MEKKIYHIPASEERTQLRAAIKDFIARGSYTPPLSMQHLDKLALEVLREQGITEQAKEWTMVELHNRVWLGVVAATPYERRILLLPKCLSSSAKCCAEIDEIGLLCHRCGNCHIPTLEDRAAELGIMSIVAEGFTAVMNLIKTGVVDAVIGVSCLDSLEKAFPLLVDNAVPGIAVPLNRAGCKDTTVDTEYVLSLMEAQTDERKVINYNAIKDTVAEWFSREALSHTLIRGTDSSSRIALDWLSGNGKRWRPYIFAATYAALSRSTDFNDEHQRVAIAIEAFHKASLAHDDIEDNDHKRYGQPTLHAMYGTSIAINVGDMLLGEGYRMIGSCHRGDMTAVIADAHIALSQGQGMELEWCSAPRAISLHEALDIFRLKTSPAFEVSLLLGLLCANGNPSLTAPLRAYSSALGVAYQLRDDVEDFDSDDPIALRPSAIFALLCEMCPEEEFVRMMIETDDIKTLLRSEPLRPLLDEALERTSEMAMEYHQRALDILEAIDDAELKSLLYRLTAKILK
jgi:geranylgeranyl pyrophosphate synthase